MKTAKYVDIVIEGMDRGEAMEEAIQQLIAIGVDCKATAHLAEWVRSACDLPASVRPTSITLGIPSSALETVA